ncbi:HNH endonuclease signature motif containing protein [Brevibacterium yomogidense]|uniref:HNH endonuclease signature motif containing protein n=1 Tax=Brevibacterium yomogidense TaxID=946573 RepID=UPI000B35FA58|nr:HNH endonuclease signature motif containing protein [Brevibacterium yomogidense]
MELVDLATTALSLARAEESSRQRMENLFEDCESDEDDCTSEQYAQLAESYEAFGAHAEYLLTTEHEATLSARLSTRTGTARKRVGQAITAYVGVPLTLSAILEGRLRFNRWEAIVRRIESLSLPHLRALDVFIVGLDPRYSLGQFTLRVCRFLADLVDKPVLAAKVRSRRTAWVEDLPDGESVGSIRGPTPLVHAWFQEGYALSAAALKRQFANVDVTPIDKTVDSNPDPDPASDSGSVSGSDSGSDSGLSSAADSTAAAGAPSDWSAASDVSSASVPESITPMTAADELPPLGSLAVKDERQIRQMMFDVITGATPRTETVLEEIDDEDGTKTRYRVGIAFSDEASVLRKHASVVVTVPMTTLMGLDDRPGTIAGAPVPADMARMVASSSTVWYRMLTDPTTGRVLDDTALKYEADRATRIAVRGKWQTCTAPGCSRPALECEIDHGIPFNHHEPELGGRTEPANLHPLCKRHHQAKTEGRLRMRRTTADEIEWIMSIGTTDTTVAPSVDDGGILSDACAVEDSPERAEARRVMRERVVTDPLTGADAADAVLAGAWRELQEEEAKRERRYAEQAAARSVREAALEAEWQRVKAWPAEERVRLEEWEARLGRRSLDVARRDERVTRDERLVSLLRADVERRRQDLRTRQQSAPQQSVPHQSVSQQSQNQQSVSRQSVSQRTEDPPEGDQSAAPSKRGESSIAMRTIIPMTTTVYEYERGVTSSLHSPLFGSRAQRAARRGEIDELAATYDEARQSGECEPGGREPGDRESGEFTSGENSVRGPRSTGKLARSASVIEDRLATELHDRMADRVPDLVVSFGQIPPADATPPWPEELRRRMASLRGDSADPPSDPPDSHKPQDSGTTHDFRESYDSREPQDSGTAAEENDPPPF